MAQNGLSVGPDYAFGLYDGTSAQILVMDDVQSVKVTKHNTSIASKPYNSRPRFAHVADGYSGSFALMRTSPILDKLEVLRDAGIYNGNVMPPSFLNETINNPDGTVSKFQYTNVDWYVTEMADVSKDKAVTRTVEFHASDRIQLS